MTMSACRAPPHASRSSGPRRFPGSLEIRNVSKAFPNVQALTDVSLDIRPGEILAFMGENGAGKSTLLKIINGDYQPDAGTLTLDGETARALPTPATRTRPASASSTRNRKSSPASTSPRTSGSASCPSALACSTAAAQRAGAPQPGRIRLRRTSCPSTCWATSSPRPNARSSKSCAPSSRACACWRSTSRPRRSPTTKWSASLRSCAACATKVWRSSTCRTASRRSCSCATAWRSCATASWSRSRPAAELTDAEIVRLMVGPRALRRLPAAARRRAGDVVLRVEDSTATGTAASAFTSTPARSSALPAWSAPAARNWPRSSLASCPRPRAHRRSTASEVTHPPPRRRHRQGHRLCARRPQARGAGC